MMSVSDGLAFGCLFVSQDFILTTGVKVDPDNMGEYAYSDVMTEDEESDRESSMMSSMR